MKTGKRKKIFKKVGNKSEWEKKENERMKLKRKEKKTKRDDNEKLKKKNYKGGMNKLN